MTEDVTAIPAGSKLPDATTFKRGNAEELAFLDELAGVAPKKEENGGGDAAPVVQPGAVSAPPASATLQEVKKGNADELAFLDELAGVAPKVEAEEDKALASTSGATMPSAPSTSEPPAGAAEGSGKSQEVAEGDAKGPDPEKKEEEETYELDATELLNAFKNDGKEEEETKDEIDAFQAFMNELRSVDRDNEVNRILWAFKLNPFEKMNLRFDATEADVRKQYRKISLLIHPDKCSHPQAADAFEVLQHAQKELLNEEVRTSLLRVLEFAREQVREERRKATKHDSALRMATYLHGKGREGVEEDWEKTDDFHEKWKMKSRDVLAKAEFRRRKLNKRVREEEERVAQEEQEEANERKKQRKEKQQWLEKRTDRIDAWRDWNKGGKKAGGIKAPKIKTSDSDRSYVQRATTEQFVGNYKKKPPK